VTYEVRLTGEAHEDLGRLYDFLLKRDLGAAERALVAIERALNLLAFSPFSCRKVGYSSRLPIARSILDLDS
jgi:plasmid stabilization system protein ParE